MHLIEEFLQSIWTYGTQKWVTAINSYIEIIGKYQCKIHHFS